MLCDFFMTFRFTLVIKLKNKAKDYLPNLNPTSGGDLGFQSVIMLKKMSNYFFPSL